MRSPRSAVGLKAARRSALALALLGVLALIPTCAARASTLMPLPESDYATRSACQASEPGRVSCLALLLVAKTAAARAHTHPLGMIRRTPIMAAKPAEGAYGLRPEDLQGAYFPGEAPQAPVSKPQTIALVDAYNDLHAESDLSTYSREFALPACTRANGCFTQVNENGETSNLPFPSNEAALIAREVRCLQLVIGETKTQRTEREAACTEVEEAGGWALEISTDIEIAHAVCQNCRILLVESAPLETSLEKGEEAAVKLGAGEISNSWGGPEPGAESKAFEHPGVAITAAAGDEGYLNWTAAAAAHGSHSTYYSGADYPASSPNVVAVGGTELNMSSGRWQSETVWNEDPSPSGGNHGAGGGGCSAVFTAPAWQQSVPDWPAVGCGDHRAVADISADGDPYTGVAVFDSNSYTYEENGHKLTTVPGWVPIGGTSVASPIIAAMFALVGGAHTAYPAQTLYSNLGSPALHDVSSGGNGECRGVYVSCSGSMTPLSALDCGLGAFICNAASGYDGPTGVGTPNGLGAFRPSGSQSQTEGTRREELKAGEEEAASPGGAGKESILPTGNPAQAGPGFSPSDGPPRSTSGATGQKPLTAQGTRTKAPRISALVLARGALAALAGERRRPARLRYSFTISASSRVRVSLAREVWVSGHWRWRTITQYSTATARGPNARQLAVGTLAAGRYLLTLTPPAGISRSSAFRVGQTHG